MSATVLELNTPVRGWTIAWRTARSGFRRYEVATSPEGVEYVKTPTRELADLIVHTKTAGDAFWKLRARPFGQPVTPGAPEEVSDDTV